MSERAAGRQNRSLEADPRSARQWQFEEAAGRPAPARGQLRNDEHDAGGDNSPEPGPFARAENGAAAAHRDACSAGTSDNAPKSPADRMRRQALTEAAQTKVVREAKPRRERDARRLGIDLPGMHGQHGGQARGVDRLYRAQHPARRGHAQAPAPSDRHRVPESIDDERRNLEDRTGRRLPHVRRPRVVDAAHDADRRHAGVERDAFADEALERPERSIVDRPFGRPERHRCARRPRRAAPRCSVSNPRRTPRGRARRRGRAGARATRCRGRPRRISPIRAWIALGDPAENEERRAGAGAIELLEQPPRGRRRRARAGESQCSCDERTDAADVEPLLDVHRDGVRARPGPRRSGGPEAHVGFLAAVM